MKRVIIVGMGFGGLRAARALAGKGLDVVLLDRQNYHLFQPLLYQVATAALEPESIAYPIRTMARRWQGTRFRLCEVTGADLEGRRVMTTDGALDYDYLILAAGCVTNFFGMESIKRHAYDLKELDHAVDLRNRLLCSLELAAEEPAPERRKMLLTFVVVGGGPTGVEFAGALAELVRYLVPADYAELRDDAIRVILIEAGERLLPDLPEELQTYALDRLEGMGVEVLLAARVAGAEPELVLLQDGTKIEAHTLFWAAGTYAAPLAAVLDLPKANGGRIAVQPDLTVAGHPEVFVVGDMAYLEQNGKLLPMVAQVAMQGGEYAARTILKRERGEAVAPFSYWDKGIMAAIGRNAAVVYSFGIKLSGFLAWLVWLGLHIFYLIGFRNRLLVLLDWAYCYLFHERQIRLITRSGKDSPCR